jgi:hypothetical protein
MSSIYIYIYRERERERETYIFGHLNLGVMLYLGLSYVATYLRYMLHELVLNKKNYVNLAASANAGKLSYLNLYLDIFI